VFIDKVTFDRSAVPLEHDGKRIVIYGDSLAVGGKVENPSAEAWPVLLRKYYPVLMEAYGYRALHDDASTAEARAELASKILSERPDYIWLAIGANDYAFGFWPAREFGEAYAATLDAIHTLNPEVILFAQSPILRVREGPNSFGASLEEYREQIKESCSARPGWCVFVDGTNPAFPQLHELDQDGIHLTIESSAKYAEAVRNQLEK
jgi:lysophospholipase L1-like esterase